MAFIDEVKIYLKAGKGGNGCISIRREKFVEFGGPDGGKGGDGGDIIFCATNKINTLLKFRYQPHITGKPGKHGQSSNKYGADGQDTFIQVPVGTQIYDLDDNLIADLTTQGQEVILAKGGKGGVGNAKSKKINSEDHYNRGDDGEERTLLLKLKIIADIGIIGLPNAGKSTFLSICSNANPKIADYAFTTLCPQIAMVNLSDYRDFVIADIPGLIEGAHQGSGLGHKFLKHIERCSALLHLVDCLQEDVIQTYEVVRNELELYNQQLLDKKELVAISRCDLLNEEKVQEKVRTLSEHLGQEVYTVSLNQSNNSISNRLYNFLNKDVPQKKFDPLVSSTHK